MLNRERGSGRREGILEGLTFEERVEEGFIRKGTE